MARKYTKRTDDEWFVMIQDCMSSGLTIKAWCQQHGITIKAFYYHRRTLRQMGYNIPQRSLSCGAREKQEAFCVDLSDGQPVHRNTPAVGTAITDDSAAIRIDFCGMSIAVSNHAAPDTVTNTLSALRMLC
ncbi:MAG: IS66 family insertion sequence element accessory protein TnpB [Clostridiales bacterium]|nr:IS66 family insertion sequence element accessory protein TnpB [Clostridiales bacterium]